MALCTCEFCGRPFNSIGTKLCAECVQQVDAAYVTVRKYIYQNPGKADFSAIIEHTELSEKMLSFLINQGRIVIGNGGGRSTRCKACGAETEGTVFCERCRNKLISAKLLTASANEKTDQRAEGCKTRPLHGFKP